MENLTSLANFKSSNEDGNICGDFSIRIARDGTWWHEGRPIRRHALVKLFSTVLQCDADGQYWLRTPAEAGRITVDDAPFVTTAIEISGLGADMRVRITTNIDKVITIDTTRPLYIGDNGVPYVGLDKGLSVRLMQSHYYELAEYAVADPNDAARLGVYSAGVFFVLYNDRGQDETL